MLADQEVTLRGFLCLPGKEAGARFDILIMLMVMRVAVLRGQRIGVALDGVPGAVGHDQRARTQRLLGGADRDETRGDAPLATTSLHIEHQYVRTGFVHAGGFVQRHLADRSQLRSHDGIDLHRRARLRIVFLTIDAEADATFGSPDFSFPPSAAFVAAIAGNAARPNAATAAHASFAHRLLPHPMPCSFAGLPPNADRGVVDHTSAGR